MKQSIIHTSSWYTVIFMLLLIASTSAAKKLEYDLDQTYSIGKQGTLTLATSDADVVVIGEKRDDVHLVVHYLHQVKGLSIISEEDPLEFDVKEDGENLYIREIGGSISIFSFVAYSSTFYDIELHVPETVSLKLKGDDDDYDIRGVNGSILMTFDDGDATLNQCGGSEFEFDFEDGTVEVNNCGGNLDLSMEDGDFIAEDCRFSSLDAYCEDGDIEIATTLQDDGEYHFRNDDGAIRLTVLDGGGDFRIYYDDGSVRATSAFDLIDEDEGISLYKLPGGNARIKLKTEDGSVRLYHD